MEVLIKSRHLRGVCLVGIQTVRCPHLEQPIPPRLRLRLPPRLHLWFPQQSEDQVVGSQNGEEPIGCPCPPTTRLEYRTVVYVRG